MVMTEIIDIKIGDMIELETETEIGAGKGNIIVMLTTGVFCYFSLGLF